MASDAHVPSTVIESELLEILQHLLALDLGLFPRLLPLLHQLLHPHLLLLVQELLLPDIVLFGVVHRMHILLFGQLKELLLTALDDFGLGL